MNYKPFQKSPIPINLFISHNLKNSYKRSKQTRLLKSSFIYIINNLFHIISAGFLFDSIFWAWFC